MQILTLNEVFVYKIPPLQGSSGHRAADWDRDNPALTGQLRLVSQGDTVNIQILCYPESSADLPQMFANCPVDISTDESKPQSKLDYFFQSATDTSRFFVLRIVDPASQRHAYLGIGFTDRESSFSLRVGLEDELKRIAREKSSVQEDEEEEFTPLEDRSLKEGETIKIKIPKKGKTSKSKAKTVGLKNSTVGTSNPTSNDTCVNTMSAQMSANLNLDDDEWGEFQS